MASEQTWLIWLQRLYNLQRDRSAAREYPDKPALLIAILDLFDRGILCHNQIPFSPELVKTYERYFEVVRDHEDSCTPDRPFYHLAGDGFWQVLAKSGNVPVYDCASPKQLPPSRVLRECFGRFDEDLWSAIVTYAASRRQLRDALISRYFPGHRDALDALLGKQNPPPGAPRPDAPGRAGAFRHTILEIYDHSCAACGLRFKTGDLSLVEAVHLVPFPECRSDRPDNGIALCPNHRWAFDALLIAPCPHPKHKAGVWSVRRDVARLKHAPEEFATLENQPLIPPNEGKFYPAPAGLAWREKRLNEAAINPV